MNWSTRLRRWVRIRMPPVREASMKPTAATVLPEPVACSNQKRRLAPGSSGASSTTSSSASSSQSSASSSSVASSSTSSSSSRSSSPRRLVGRSVSLAPFSEASSSIFVAARGVPLPLPAQGWPLSRSCTSAISAASVPERASTWWAESSAPSARCGVSSESSRSRPSMSEKSRRHSIDGRLAALVDLDEGGVERSPPGRARARGPSASLPPAGRARERTREHVRCRRS